ncbi:hypothetical protein EG328_010040 [Venturia inaequalis]|uniref:Uncharacterized protein n=2 Tax=Venturia inaequalis TaxID=5025 RepID=A0A8H3U8D7_VENIN|nr:hypothetical protein EG328_010040 [Venturia inaequalis]KAE9991014.1 hypothetical protein EG327_000616 [Venturia inaequalis]
MSRSHSVRRDKLRRSLSVQEKNEYLTGTGCSWSPISPISPISPNRYSAPPSPIDFPVHLSVDEVSSEPCTFKQDWPLTVPRLAIPRPGPRQTDRLTNMHLQIPRQTSDDYVLSPASPCAYTPLVNDLKFFTAIPRCNPDKKPTIQHSEITLADDAIPKRLTSLSKKGVKRTASTRAKGHKRGKIAATKILPEVTETRVQTPEVPSHSDVDIRSESPSFAPDQSDARQRKDSLGSPLRPARSISGRRNDGNFLPVRAPTSSTLQPLTEEPTALERKKMPLVTAIVPAPGPNKITKSTGPLRRFSTRRKRRTEAPPKPLPSVSVPVVPVPAQNQARDTRSPSPMTTESEAEFTTTIKQVVTISRPMSPAEFEEANTSPSYPSSSFGPKPTSPWSQLFKRSKSPSPREEISGFLGKLRGKGREREGGVGEEEEVRERRRGELRRKIGVVEMVNMRSAFED